MKQPEPRPVGDHLDHWERHELADAGEAVAGLLETEAWKYIERSIADRLRFEQKILMRSVPTGQDETYERTVGQWAGLNQARAIAEGIVERGKQAEREMREPDSDAATGG